MKNQSVTPITPELAASLLPDRPDDSHKGSFGKALIVAGSAQFPGAANLAIQAALRSGAGLVYAAIPASIYTTLTASIPEAIWYTLEEKAGQCPTDDKDAILVGPGLGLAAATQTMLLALLARLREQSPSLPLVVDADALNCLCQQPDWSDLLLENSVLTPHVIEFSRLTGLPVSQIHANRQKLAVHFAKTWEQTLILKGANTLVVSAEGECRMLPFANSVLAHGGTGDVLAGLLVGLLAQGLPPFDAAALAVWLHSRAALLALEEVGHAAATLPSDIIRKLGRAMSSLQ